MANFINFSDYGPDALNRIFERAAKIKADPHKFSQVLKGRRMYMLFQKTSTRTALSFALGMTDLGGSYFTQKWEDSNFMLGEIQDEIRFVGRNADIVMARLKYNDDINLMAKYSTVPVINGCCNKFHPCQAVADMLTVRELFGGFRIKMLYIGVHNNVLNSLMESLPALGGDLYALTPIVNQPSKDGDLEKKALGTGRFHAVDPAIGPGDLKKLLNNIDVVYTDSWIDMEFFNDPRYQAEKEERIAKMAPYQLNSGLLDGSKALVMHDMPIHAGYEISRDTVEKHIDTILRQAENRRHGQNGVLVTLLEDANVRKMLG